MRTEDRLPFRPLDNSPTTNLSYSLEANHWLRAINSAQASTMSYSSSFSFIGLLFGIAISAVLMIFALLIKLFSFIFGGNKVKDNTYFNVNRYKHNYQFQEEKDDDYFKTW